MKKKKLKTCKSTTHRKELHLRLLRLLLKPKRQKITKLPLLNQRMKVQLKMKRESSSLEI
jgi:hypothetical protein